MAATIRGVSGEYATDLQRQAQDHAAALERNAERLHQDATHWHKEAAQHRQRAQQLQQLLEQQGWFKSLLTKHRLHRESKLEAKATKRANGLSQQRSQMLDSAKTEHAKSQQAAAGVQAEREVVQALHDIPGVSDIICGLSFGPALGDIDVIALGSRVVVLEVKAGHGKVTIGSDGRVYHGSQVVPRNPIEQCTKQLQLLREAGVQDPVGLVAFPQAQPEVMRVAGTGIVIVGGLDCLRQQVQSIMERPRQAGTPSVHQLVRQVDGWLANKSNEMNHRLNTAYQFQQRRSENMQRWHNDLERWRSWNNAAGMKKKQERCEQIAKVSAEFDREQQNIEWLRTQVMKWEEARRSNNRLTT
jgi:hypothetical protein